MGASRNTPALQAGAGAAEAPGQGEQTDSIPDVMEGAMGPCGVLPLGGGGAHSHESPIGRLPTTLPSFAELPGEGGDRHCHTAHPEPGEQSPGTATSLTVQPRWGRLFWAALPCSEPFTGSLRVAPSGLLPPA